MYINKVIVGTHSVQYIDIEPVVIFLFDVEVNIPCTHPCIPTIECVYKIITKTAQLTQPRRIFLVRKGDTNIDGTKRCHDLGNHNFRSLVLNIIMPMIIIFQKYLIKHDMTNSRVDRNNT